MAIDQGVLLRVADASGGLCSGLSSPPEQTHVESLAEHTGVLRVRARLARDPSTPVGLGSRIKPQ
jgi:hypothetical protein